MQRAPALLVLMLAPGLTDCVAIEVEPEGEQAGAADVPPPSPLHGSAGAHRRGGAPFRQAAGRHDERPAPLVSSTAHGDDGARYVAGVFAGTLVVGGLAVTSHGGVDVFVARLESHGAASWAHAVGSSQDERDPKVSFSDGRVTLVGMTDGSVDCGQGSLSTWSTETFFVCTFEPNGTPINGASFPTGRAGRPSRSANRPSRPEPAPSLHAP